LAPCPVNEVGEIWVRGPSVANGYWNNPRETECTFLAMLSDSKEGPFLRTGDLGFLYEGELYITGRLKNLIISEGKNHYPHDIERTVEDSHPSIRPAGCAVFSICKSGVELIIIIVEHDQKLVVKEEEVVKAIRRAVSINHELHVNDIRLINAGGIPKTSSGKTRHFLCKEYYLAGTFNEIKSI
ncbi:MAG: AMP-binding protein, partial [bacterium]|nr:AMP-binding protein [bacterium]